MTVRLIFLATALALPLGCDSSAHRHDHSEAHPEGHDHHEEGHGHGEGPVVSFTLWSDSLEIFGEHSPAVAGHPVSFLVHVTKLEDFSAVEQASLTLVLEGQKTLRETATKALRPGIFQLQLTPEATGTYRGRIEVRGEGEGVVEGLVVHVHADEKAATRAVAEPSDEGRIEFLKEQQWGVPFGTAFAKKGTLFPSVEVTGRVQTPPGGSAVVSAPVTGRLVSPAAGLLRPGTEVKAGQLLASLSPAPSSPEAAARASLQVAEAEARAGQSRAALERAERLIKDEAISQRELEDARREARVAEESVRAAQQAAALYSGASASSGAGTWKLVAPIDGVLVSVDATPGATVSPGETLFRVVDPKELWIVAKVPEQEAARFLPSEDASFQVAGLSTWTPMRLAGDEATAQVVSVGRVVDPRSRTVDVIYSLKQPHAALRVGGLVRVSLPVGESFSGVVIPRAALIDEEGRAIVYVQDDGEHFSERQVRPGPRAGGFVGIRSGLREGERIVTEGAHLVRLAERASGPSAHGHIH